MATHFAEAWATRRPTSPSSTEVPVVLPALYLGRSNTPSPMVVPDRHSDPTAPTGWRRTASSSTLPTRRFNTEVAPPIEAFAAEPFYQLLRYQLMARQAEVRKAGVIDSASVLYVYVDGNRGLRRVIVPEFREIGRDVFEVWSDMLTETRRLIPATTNLLCSLVLEDTPLGFTGWASYVKDRYRLSRS